MLDKNVIVEDFNGSKTELIVPFITKKYKWGFNVEPAKDARCILNQFRSWQVVGEEFKSESIVSTYGNDPIEDKRIALELKG